MKVLTRFFAALLTCLVLSGTAYAEPHLDGPLIESINTDQSHYQTGASPVTTVTLTNNTVAPFSGVLIATVYSRGHTFSTPRYAAVSSLASGATTTAQITLPAGEQQYQGYFVQIVAQNSSGIVKDTQSTSYDVSPDWWVYPRQCWVVGAYKDWGGWVPDIFGTPEHDTKSLNAYKCNNLQMYNMLFRWHKPWTDGLAWVNGDGENIVIDLMKRFVTAAHSLSMGTLMYMPIYGANYGIKPDFTQDGSGASLKWGMFTSACGANGGYCTIADLWKFNDKIAYMNPNDPNWQKYWGMQAELFRQKIGFDGMFADTFGTINTPLWDWSANRIIMDTAYSSFLKTVTQYMKGPIIMNPAGSYNEEDLVRAAIEKYHFTERWNNPSDIGSFPDFLAKSLQVWGWANRTPNNIGLDWDMGMNKTLGASSSCTINGGTTLCTFNTPGVMYQEDTMLATGAHHAWMVGGEQAAGNGASFISNDDFPIGHVLTPKPDLVQAEYDAQTFGVAYEKLLRLNMSKSTLTAPSVLNGSFSNTGEAGKIWAFQMHRSGFEVVHLLNYQAMSQTSFQDVNDNCACASAPSYSPALNVKIYYPAGASLTGAFMASPDMDHGLPHQLTYAMGSDASGSYVTVQVPWLHFWDMIWLETNLSSSDYSNL